MERGIFVENKWDAGNRPEREDPRRNRSSSNREVCTALEGWTPAVGQVVEPKVDLQRFAAHPANLAFLELYGGKRRRDPVAWRDYFTSRDFLEVFREVDFMALLLEEVRERREECPPSREFLTWLSVAYQFISKMVDGERKFGVAQGAELFGLENIFEISEMGPIPKRFAGTELAVSISFYEYTQLMDIADQGVWNDKDYSTAKHILGRYTLAYLKDKCEKREWNDVERHPAGLRLLEHFFTREDLPEELYRMLWRTIDGKSVIMGRPKVLYGRLRELALERVPGLLEDGDDNFRRLRQDFRDFTRRCGGPDQGEALADVFFAREDFQKALVNRRFITEQLMTYDWGNEQTPACFLRRLLAFYQAHPEAPHAGEMAERTERVLQKQSIRVQMAEDGDAPVPPEVPGLNYRPFFRHWLNTAFRGAQTPEGESLDLYLSKNMAYCPKWSRRFLEVESGAIRPKRVLGEVGGRDLEAVFCLWYVDFRVDGMSLCAQPMWNWEQWSGWEGDSFFLFLPLVKARPEQFEEVRDELTARLASTAAPEKDRGTIAGFLAGYVCRPEPSETPWRWYAETPERLYDCAWWAESQELYFFEESGEKRKVLDHYTDIPNQPQAQAIARRLLDEAVSPTNFQLAALPVLPDEIVAQPVGAPLLWLRKPREDPEPEDFEDEDDSDDEDLDGGDPEDELEYENDTGMDAAEYERALEEAQKKRLFIDYGYPVDKGEATAEALRDLLTQFSEGKMRRMALHWGADALVFIQHRDSLLQTGGEKYACLYFHQAKHIYFGLLSQPEAYETVDSNDVTYERFGLGTLPFYAIHHSPASVLRHLDKIFPDMGRGGEPGMFAGGHYLWCSKVSLNDGQQRFMIARQKLGGIPYEQYLLAKFVISTYPGAVEKLTVDGEETYVETGRTRRGEASAALVEFMQQKLARLRLTWRQGEDKTWHVVLLKDGGLYVMAVLEDVSETMMYLNTDRLGFLKRSRKSPLVDFQGRMTPSYYVHSNLEKIRNCLDLLLEDITDLPTLIEEMAAFCPEVDLSYSELRARLITER